MSFRFRPNSEEFHQDPHRVFSQMRQEAPIYTTGKGFVFLSRYEHVAETLKNPESSVNYMEYCEGDAAQYLAPIRDLRASNPIFGSFNTMIRSDDPSHRRMKHLTLPHFTAKKVAELGQLIEQTVDNYLDQCKPGEVIDIATSVSKNIPIDTIFHILGLSMQDKQKLTDWAHQLTLILEPLQTSTDGMSSIQELFPETMMYLVNFIEERRKNPKENDVVTDLLNKTIDDSPLTYEEIVSTVGLLYLAGIETTVFFLANAIHSLLTDDDARSEWMNIASDARSKGEQFYSDSTALNAVDELVRHSGSVWMTARVNKVDFDYVTDGAVTTVPKGTLINVLMASANRDERVFENPDAINLRRSNAGKHLGFSHGPHYCLGTHLAKLEGLILFERLFSRFPNTQVVGEPVWRRRMTFRGIEQLKVRLEP